MRRWMVLLLICPFFFIAGCNSPPPGRGAGETLSAPGNGGQQVQFRVETVAEKLEVPWGIAFAPDGRVFFTERAGRVR